MNDVEAQDLCREGGRRRTAIGCFGSLGGLGLLACGPEDPTTPSVRMSEQATNNSDRTGPIMVEIDFTIP
jgi:hypothetical protein